MIFCVRKPVFADVSFWSDTLGRQLPDLGIPIEIGLPFDFTEFTTIAGQLPVLGDELLSHSPTCVAVHAPEGAVITHYPDTFLEWALGISDFADQVSAKVIVVHPVEPTAMSHRRCLDLLAQNIAALQEKTQATVVVETFRAGYKWIGYKDLITTGLPVCLDTSHLQRNATVEVIEQHLGQVKHVHLSEAVPGAPHLPVGEFATLVANKLKKKGWAGSVCLEYMDDDIERAVEDCKRLDYLFR